MSQQLAWNWLAAPYLACALAIVAAGVAAALVRGDRVLRLGLLGATASALPWAVCSAIACCTDDAELATRVLRVGVGPVALVGPDILLILLGVSGQLERYRALARLAAVGGGLLLVACWFTDWTVAGARRLSSGIFYPEPGPLTWLHMAQLAAWIAVGLVIARRATPSGERRRMFRLLVLVVVLVAIGGSDTLVLYSRVGSYPVAWLSIGIACAVGTYLAVRTDFLRPRGFDRGALAEVGGFVVASAAIGGIAVFLPGASPLPFAALGAVIWVIAMASAWAVARRYGTPVTADLRAGELVARIAELASDADIAEEVAGAWRDAIGIEPMAAWRADPAAPHQLIAINATATAWSIDPAAAAWLARRAEPVATIDLATIRLGPLRPMIEGLGHAHGATLLVPLVDRGELAGVIEARYDRPLREGERVLVSTSARAAARQLAFVRLAEVAAREGETAREVEVAEAMRVSASRQADDALGEWAVATAYRNRDAGGRGGASWSASLLPDGRLALLVAEAHGPGLVAALGTAALTGAFSAATLDDTTLDAILASLRGAADDVLHEPVAAFVALLDRAGRLEWGTAGHPGGHVVGAGGAVALGGGGHDRELGASMLIPTRGAIAMPPDALLVVASTALRGDDDDAWLAQLRDLEPAGGKLAQLAVERAAARGGDLLAVVVRHR